MCLEENVKTMNQGLIDTLSLDCLKRNDETAKFKVKWGISRQLSALVWEIVRSSLE